MIVKRSAKKIVSGAEFGDLAKMYSQGSEQESGGDWGWVDRKKLNEDLTKVAFSLKPGEVSKVVELSGSYYLLIVEAKKAAAAKSLKDLHGEIEKALIQQQRQSGFRKTGSRSCASPLISRFTKGVKRRDAARESSASLSEIRQGIGPGDYRPRRWPLGSLAGV